MKRTARFAAVLVLVTACIVAVASLIQHREELGNASAAAHADDIAWIRSGPHTEAEETRRAIEKNTAALKARR